MRLHHLSITAFGPFADTVSVDFDELSEAGLFLLTGSTGAGKTSVLDAVCFALYGQVPGDRAGAKHLRSDHAPPDRAPEVRLQLSIGEREFSFTRSPAWMRPKLRGTGETKVQAHVLVEELVAGRWQVLSNRLDDAGLLVGDLLGMTASQFTQVAMLPQGRFQAFLRATSAERHSVLQQLFRTDRFERIEEWLVRRRTETRRTCEAAAGEVREVIHRFQEASGVDAEPEWLEDLSQADSSGALRSWTDEICSAAALAEAEAQRVSEAADAVAISAAAALQTGQQIVERRSRGLAARTELEYWRDRASDVDQAQRRYAEHQHAAPISELAGARTAAARAAEEAKERWSHRRDLAGLKLAVDVDRDDLAAAQRSSHDALALAASFAPRAEAASTARSRLESIRHDLQSLETGISELELTLGKLPATISEAVAAVHEARAAAARHPVVLARIERLETAQADTKRAELIGLEIVAARTDILSARDAAQRAKENYLDLREARINGMASELAGQLASGCSCPVCGSSEHPSPALTAVPGLGRSDEDQARKALDDAEFELQTRQVGLATLEGELTSLDQRLAGVDREQLPADLTEARDEAERLEPLVAALDVLIGREARCREDLKNAESEHRAALLQRAELQASADQLATSISAHEKEWASLLSCPGAGPGEGPEMDLPALLACRRRRAESFDAALADLDAYDQARAIADDLSDQVTAAALKAGFPTAESALSALISSEESARLQELITTSQAAVRSATATLESPEVIDALSVPDPNLMDLKATYDTAVASGRGAAAASAASAARRVRLDELKVHLDSRVCLWKPLQEQHQVVAELASFTEGKSVDNQQRMRLAAYVLAERLRQVVDAANERLTAMSDQRYALEQTDNRGYGEQRGGLSLRIRDDWNGVHRDPATLSGGETFVVSLALALGLADTVAHEAGGTDIDTLFIDEGFGSLDADTLEDVMDTLDTLRDGGRVVGLVSHVPELRSRITTQLEVAKGRTGSTVRATVSTG